MALLDRAANAFCPAAAKPSAKDPSRSNEAVDGSGTAVGPVLKSLFNVFRVARPKIPLTLISSITPITVTFGKAVFAVVRAPALLIDVYNVNMSRRVPPFCVHPLEGVPRSPFTEVSNPAPEQIFSNTEAAATSREVPVIDNDASDIFGALTSKPISSVSRLPAAVAFKKRNSRPVAVGVTITESAAIGRSVGRVAKARLLIVVLPIMQPAAVCGAKLVSVPETQIGAPATENVLARANTETTNTFITMLLVILSNKRAFGN